MKAAYQATNANIHKCGDKFFLELFGTKGGYVAYAYILVKIAFKFVGLFHYISFKMIKTVKIFEEIVELNKSFTQFIFSFLDFDLSKQ